MTNSIALSNLFASTPVEGSSTLSKMGQYQKLNNNFQPWLLYSLTYPHFEYLLSASE